MRTFSFLIFILSLLSLSCFAATQVNVRGYKFAPFVTIDKGQKFSGATLEIIKELNKVQSEYNFVFKETSAKRRYSHLQENNLDLIFFEDKAWGWQNYDVDNSQVFARGGEIFFALKTQAKSQSYFKTLKDKRLIGVLGFHYKFAGYNSDEKYLKNNFNMILTSTPSFVVDLILKKRGDVGIITESLLRNTIEKRPELKDSFIVSKNYDQHYSHTILIRKGGPINKEQVNQLLIKLKKSGALYKILKKYGIKGSDLKVGN